MQCRFRGALKRRDNLGGVQVEQCADHNKFCESMGGFTANIANLTAAILALNVEIKTFVDSIHKRINKIEDEIAEHQKDSLPFREKIIATETVLRNFIKSQEEKERQAMWRIGIIVTIINVVANLSIRWITTIG
jgi:hypothetical protein